MGHHCAFDSPSEKVKGSSGTFLACNALAPKLEAKARSPPKRWTHGAETTLSVLGPHSRPPAVTDTHSDVEIIGLVERCA